MKQKPAIERHEKEKKRTSTKSLKKYVILGSILCILIISLVTNYYTRTDTVANLNGEKVSKEDFDLMYKRITEKDPAAEKSKVLEQLVGNKLIAQDAKNNGVEVKAEEVEILIKKAEESYKKPIGELLKTIDVKEEIFREMLIEYILIGKRLEQIKGLVTVTDDEVENYYNTHKEQFMVLKEFEYAQIVLLDDDGKEIYNRLKKGEDFAALALQYSKDKETAKKGGYVGIITQQKKELSNIEKTLFSLKEGEFSQPTHTPGGTFIFKINKIVPEKTISLEETKENLKNLMLEEKQKMAVNQYAQTLYKESDVKLYEENI